ncbi:DUF6171 family protein [Cohnella yongneupensis]|uniref:DUF6171 family protein n=1 Tax=Cohnella yongneupensis TaxID=425006 RepID=A0ABW0QZD1_9BACL
MIYIIEAGIQDREGCKGCSASVHATAEQIQRLLSKVKAEHSVSDEQYAMRLAACRTCESLAYASTCMHCGCFVQVRAKFKDKGCPHPDQAVRLRWTSLSTPLEEA